MTQEKNIRQFNKDIEVNVGYLYTATVKLSSRLANQRLSDAVRQITNLSGKRIIDVGCGDGTYTIELLAAQPSYVLGVDPAEAAVNLGRRKSAAFNNIEFKVSDIYNLASLGVRFDVAIVRGVLHHLYDIKKAIANLSQIADEVIIIEPNGYNPILKIIEKMSRYHRAHEEKSYFPHQLDQWFIQHGGSVVKSFYCGLVPFFCPDIIARTLKILEPLVERIPILKQLGCAVYVLKSIPGPATMSRDSHLKMQDMKMTPRSCPVCGSNDDSKVFAEANFNLEQLDDFAFASRKFPEYMHYRLISCPACDLLYANPVPESGMLAMAYAEAAFDSSEEARYASSTYASFLPNIIKRIPNLVGAIDIGTGDGAFLEQLLVNGFTGVVGIEPSKAPISHAKDEIRPMIRYGIFNPEEYESESFSLVTCFQTLEHLYDPMEMCQNAHRMLKKGGAVFFISHNRRSLSARLLGMHSPIFDIEHLQLFSAKSAGRMLEKNGFVDVEIKAVYNCYPLHYWIKLFPMPISLKRASISFFKKAGIGYLPISISAGNMAIIGYKR